MARVWWRWAEGHQEEEYGPLVRRIESVLAPYVSSSSISSNRPAGLALAERVLVESDNGLEPDAAELLAHARVRDFRGMLLPKCYGHFRLSSGKILFDSLRKVEQYHPPSPRRNAIKSKSSTRGLNILPIVSCSIPPLPHLIFHWVFSFPFGAIMLGLETIQIA